MVCCSLCPSAVVRLRFLTLVVPFHWDLIQKYFQTAALSSRRRENKNGGKSGFLCIFVSFTLHPLFNYFALTILLESIGTLCADFSSNQQVSRLVFSPALAFDMDWFNFFFNSREVEFVGICCSLSANDIKAGTNIEVDGAPWRVLGNLSSWFLLIKGFYFLKLKIMLLVGLIASNICLKECTILTCFGFRNYKTFEFWSLFCFWGQSFFMSSQEKVRPLWELRSGTMLMVAQWRELFVLESL